MAGPMGFQLCPPSLEFPPSGSAGRLALGSTCALLLSRLPLEAWLSPVPQCP